MLCPVVPQLIEAHVGKLERQLDDGQRKKRGEVLIRCQAECSGAICGYGRSRLLEAEIARGFRLVQHPLDSDAAGPVREPPVECIPLPTAQDSGAHAGANRQPPGSVVRVIRVDQHHLQFLVIQLQQGSSAGWQIEFEVPLLHATKTAFSDDKFWLYATQASLITLEGTVYSPNFKPFSLRTSLEIKVKHKEMSYREIVAAYEAETS